MAYTMTTDTIAAGYTQQNIADKIVTLLTAALGAPLNRYSVSTTLRAVFGPLPKTNPTDKAVYLVVDVTSGFVIQWQLALTFTAPSTLGTLTAQSSRTYATNTSNILLTLFHKAGEGTFLVTQQGSTQGFFAAMMLPETPSWWDRTVHSPVMLMSNSSINTGFTLLTSTNDAPATGNNTVYIGKPGNNVAGINGVTGKRDVIKGVYFNTPNAGIGRSSDDLATCAGAVNVLDKYEVTAGVEEYTVIETGGASFGFRTV